MEMLPRHLAASLKATEVRLVAPVVRLSGSGDGRYWVDSGAGRVRRRESFDAVVVALPHAQLRRIEWAGERLQHAMARHVAHYDHPAHYLRVSVLFDRRFWREQFHGSWLMLDAFGGCCVYDESGANGAAGAHGVLGWLLAGADALSLCSLADDALVERVIGSLPGALQRKARPRIVEGRVHRWAGALSGMPGGSPLRDAAAAHQPEPIAHPRLAVVGDYLFDSTLNGVLRSAEIAAGLLRGGRALHVSSTRYSSASRRSSRALSQSRRTVRSVMPSAPAISASVNPPK
jgi:monoamine oxidase